MFYVLQNESTAALRRVPILLTDAATGTTAQTGIALTNIFPYVNINGGAFAGGAGTVAEAGYGQYYYQFDASEVATLGLAGIHITAVGCRDYDAIAQVAAFNMYSGGGVGISAGDVWNYDISSTVTAGTAGSQLNTAATGGAGATAGDVWDYVLISTGTSADSTLGDAKQYALQADSQTQATNLRPAVWDFNINSGFASTDIPYPLGYIIQAGDATTTAAASVWNYDISGVSGAGLAGTQLNLAASAIGITAGDVWSYVDRTITGGIADTVTSVINTVDISTQSVTDIWSEDVSGYSTPSAGFDLTLAASGGAGITSGDVWSYASRTITGGIADTVTTVSSPVEISTAAMAGVANTVWTYVTRTLTSGGGITSGDVSNAVWNSPVASYSTNGTFGKNILRADAANKVGDVTLYSAGGINGVDADVHRISNDTAAATNLKNALSGIGASWTGNVVGNVTGSVGSVTADVNVSTASMSGIANTVWNTDVSSFTSPSAGYDVHNGAGTAISAFDVWNYTLTSSGQSADATLGNADDQATNAATNTNSPTLEANVWGYASRTITGGSVTSVVNGVTVTTNNDKTGYSLSGTQTFDLTGNITGSVSGSVGSVVGSVGSVVSPVNVSTTSMSGIANTVWTTPTKTITGGTVDTVTNPVSVSTTSMTGIAGTVWTYGTRTLTSGAGATAGDIWSYNISGITASGTAGATLNDASVSGSVVTIVNGPYRLTSIAEGTDGRIDILADSVQTIQLNCLDGFGQPFNVTGYTAAVNVYDVSGALAVTYTPTVDFASSGIVSFDIDTDVTGTTGRYTLVVELTAGAEVVQLGPLEILVRPL